jgi:hypothetical protein
MSQYASTNLAPGQTVPQALSALSSSNVNGILAINSSGYAAYIGDSAKTILFTIPAGQGISIPYRSGGGLFAWTDANVSNAGFGTLGSIRITLTSDELKLSGGVLIDAYNVPNPSVNSYNGRTGIISGISTDVTNALGYTPANVAAVVASFNGRGNAVSLTGPDVTTALGYTPAASTNVVNSFNGRTGAVTLAPSDLRALGGTSFGVSTFTPPPAPSTVTNPSGGQDLDLYIMGGTVSLIEFSRDNVSFYPVSSPITLSPNDRIRITYTVAPLVTRIYR